MRWTSRAWIGAAHFGVRHLAALAALAAVVLFGANPPALAQPQPQPPTPSVAEPFEGLPVREVRILGLERVSRALVLNQIRTAVGQPYSSEIVRQDVRNLTRLNQFRQILPLVEPTDDGGVIVSYGLVEWPLAAGIEVTGNRTVRDDVILGSILMRPGDPLDTFQINRARETIVELYRRRGFYLAEVDVDPTALAESDLVLFRVREGPRVRIRAIEFEGNRAFTDAQLRTNIRTRTSVFLMRTGELDHDALAADVAAITSYYADRGHLDVRVERQIDLSPDLREAKVVFLIEEGRVYTMRRVEVEGATRLLPDQIAALMEIKPGDVYSRDRIERSRRAVEQSLGRIGYVDSRVTSRPARDPVEPLVDLFLTVEEGPLAFSGEVEVFGNITTRRDVVMREAEGIRPGRPLSRVEVQRAEQNLRATRLFEDVKITILPPEPHDPLHRDVVIEVVEGPTGELNFGAAVSSDLGLFGAISFTQRNFDIADFPESFDELIRGRAFRGAGQTFSISAQPGARYSNYSISLAEPYLFGTDNALLTSFSFLDRRFEAYDQSRLGGRLQLTRRLGRVWSIFTSARFQSLELRNIDPDAPRDVFRFADEHVLTGLGLGLTRTTVDHRFRPTRGSRTEFFVEQVGVMGGDFDFSKVEGEHSIFVTLEEDFLGRRTVLSLSSRAGYLFGGDTPIYERYFLGGRSLRGFQYRTVSPKGIRADTGRLGRDPVGGDWMFFAGAQYEFPIFDRFVGGVFFVDSGTVRATPGFGEYRVGVGTGLRLYIPQLGEAPLAFDFGFPIVKEPGDERRIFSFSIQLPF